MRHLHAIAGPKGNIVVSTRAALRAQHLVMLLEQGWDMEKARRKIGVARRTANRYRATWGRN